MLLNMSCSSLFQKVNIFKTPHFSFCCVDIFLYCFYVGDLSVHLFKPQFCVYFFSTSETDKGTFVSVAVSVSVWRRMLPFQSFHCRKSSVKCCLGRKWTKRSAVCVQSPFLFVCICVLRRCFYSCIMSVDCTFQHVLATKAEVHSGSDQCAVTAS